jgi:hypothetical protein
MKYKVIEDYPTANGILYKDECQGQHGPYMVCAKTNNKKNKISVDSLVYLS